MDAPFTLKFIVRSWKVNLIILLGVTLASMFFSGVSVGADVAAGEILREEIARYESNPEVMRIPFVLGVMIGEGLRHLPSVDEMEGILKAIRRMEYITRVDLRMILHSRNITLPDGYVIDELYVIGFSENSTALKGLSLGLDDAYVWLGSKDISKLKVGTVIPYGNFTVETSSGRLVRTFNLTITGTIDRLGFGENSIIVNWRRFGPILKLLKEKYVESPSPSYFSDVWISVRLDVEGLVDPWDLEGSIRRLEGILYKIDELPYLWCDPHLEVPPLLYVLNSAKKRIDTLRFNLIFWSIPVIFLAWYTGSLFAESSYNLRRREVALLTCKGFSKRMVLKLFLFESLILGVSGGVLGTLLSYLASPYFAQAYAEGTYSPLNVHVKPSIILSGAAFGALLGLASTLHPARKALKLSLDRALRVYMPLRGWNPLRSKLVWTAFTLGLYKVVTWLSGFHLVLLNPPSMFFTNILLSIVVGALGVFDLIVLNFIGSFLFLWGSLKLLAYGLAEAWRILKQPPTFMGNIGLMASRNLLRNPGRAASTLFLVAMVTSYSVYAVGLYYSELDFTFRQVKFTVGADVAVVLEGPGAVEKVIDAIKALPFVSSMTVEYRFWSSSIGGEVVAIDPESWFDVAYYDPEIFHGSSLEEIREEMIRESHTIILENGVAKDLKAELNGKIAFHSENIKVVGFVGGRVTGNEAFHLVSLTYSLGLIKFIPSYIPLSLYEEIRGEISPKPRILLRVKPGFDLGDAVDAVRGLNLDGVLRVISLPEEVARGWQNPHGTFYPYMPVGLVPSGSLKLQYIGVAFALIASASAILLQAAMWMLERERETCILYSKGFSYGQIVSTITLEALMLYLPATMIGVAVGFLTVYGNISASNTILLYSTPLLHHLVFPLSSILTLAASMLLTLASLIIPAPVMTKLFLSRRERILREE